MSNSPYPPGYPFGQLDQPTTFAKMAAHAEAAAQSPWITKGEMSAAILALAEKECVPPTVGSLNEQFCKAMAEAQGEGRLDMHQTFEGSIDPRDIDERFCKAIAADRMAVKTAAPTVRHCLEHRIDALAKDYQALKAIMDSLPANVLDMRADDLRPLFRSIF